MDTTRLSDELLELAETVGDHPEPTEDVIIKIAPKTKVVKNSSKRVHTK